MSDFQVIQQQQWLQTNQPSVLFNPETQTKIIYRVVYPSDIHRSGGGGKSDQPAAYGRKRFHRRSSDGAADAENSSSRDRASATRLRHRRTRSGRVCRPPQYMVKDYKQVPTVEVEVDDAAAAAGYSDFNESSGDEANAADDNAQSRPRAAFDVDDSIPVGKPNRHRDFYTAS